MNHKFLIYDQGTCIGEVFASSEQQALDIYCAKHGWANQAGLFAERVELVLLKLFVQ